MTAEAFVSFAQNGEDVVLWRALRHVSKGCYVDVGAWEAVDDSVTKAFYDRGWRGVSVEPVPAMAEALRAARPGEEVVQAAVSSTSEPTLTLHQVQSTGSGAEITGLSTLDGAIAARHGAGGYRTEVLTVPTRTLASVFESPLLQSDVHFLKVDVEGAEGDVLRSMDFETHRPWILVIEATRPGSTEPSHEEWEPLVLEAGYELCLFDGLSRFYVAQEHPELRANLSYPACVFDDFVTAREHAVREEREAIAAERARLWEDVVRWRALALDAWSESFGKLAERQEQVARLRSRLRNRNIELRQARRELRWMHSSVSWRVTQPLRAVRSRTPRPTPES